MLGAISDLPALRLSKHEAHGNLNASCVSVGSKNEGARRQNLWIFDTEGHRERHTEEHIDKQTERDTRRNTQKGTDGCAEQLTERYTEKHTNNRQRGTHG